MRLGAGLAALSLFVALAPAALWSQEEGSLDDLFDDPAGDTVATDVEVDHLSQYVTNDKIVWSGYFDATGGVGAGWTGWPLLSDLSSGFDGTIGLSATANLYVDARPSSDFRFYGYVTTTMDPLSGSYTWTGFSIGELFVDYTWLDAVFVRMGQQDIAWGQSRLFESVTDIMVDAVTGFTLKATLPTLLDGVSVMGMAQEDFFGSGVSYMQLGYAAKADKVLGGTFLSLGARYQQDEGLRVLGSAKRTLLGVDLSCDVIYRYAADAQSWQALAGFFKQWQDFLIYGEYYYDGRTAGGLDHSVALALGFNNVFGSSLDFGVQWFHAFIDNSGVVTPGLTWKPWKLITATVGLPVSYGPDGGRYVAALNEDPAKRRLALAFTLELETTF